MNLLFIADIVGKPGRAAVEAGLAAMRSEREIDFVIANCENAAGGFGVTAEIAQGLFDLGIDILTSGNHIWDRREVLPVLDQEPLLLRPHNYPPENPGRGVAIGRAQGLSIAVVNLQGRVFMPAIDCPFRLMTRRLLKELEGKVDLIFVDFHAEATAEKIAFGWYVDGRVTAVVGTHTHVQTADARILPGGTAYLTDAGMTGAVDGVIGVKKELAIERFLTLTQVRFETSPDDPWLNGVLVEGDSDGRARSIQQLLVPADR